MPTIKEIFTIITTPSLWFLTYPICKELDKQLEEMMEHPVVQEISEHTITINGVRWWSGNMPWCCGFESHIKDRTPSRTNMLRFTALVEKESLEMRKYHALSDRVAKYKEDFFKTHYSLNTKQAEEAIQEKYPEMFV